MMKGGEYFSLDELLADTKIKEHNEDIIKYIDELYNIWVWILRVTIAIGDGKIILMER